MWIPPPSNSVRGRYWLWSPWAAVLRYAKKRGMRAFTLGIFTKRPWSQVQKHAKKRQKRSLPEWHYAASWPQDSAEAVRPLAEVTELGRRYAETKDEGVLLEICRCFHPYLMKYLVMICRGHVPVLGVGKSALRINKDVEPFIRYFLPKGEVPSRPNLGKVVRTFHLAFKDMEPEEIYDLISAINGYDPNYKDKLKEVVDAIKHELPRQKKFAAALVNQHVGFDCTRHLRLLARTDFLETLPGRGEAKRISARAPAGTVGENGRLMRQVRSQPAGEALASARCRRECECCARGTRARHFHGGRRRPGCKAPRRGPRSRFAKWDRRPDR